MTLLTNDDFAKSELSTSELEAISGGLHLTHGPNPPMGGAGGGCHPPHHPPYLPPIHYYPLTLLNFH
jgi:bacteriocin-like protein